jgi:hypothetical protein
MAATAKQVASFEVGDRVVFRDPDLRGNVGTVQKWAGHGWVRVKWDGAIAQLGTIESTSKLMLARAVAR